MKPYLIYYLIYLILSQNSYQTSLNDSDTPDLDPIQSESSDDVNQENSNQNFSQNFKQQLQRKGGISFLNEEGDQGATQVLKKRVITYFTYRSSPDRIFKAVQKDGSTSYYERDNFEEWQKIEEIPSKDENDIYVIKNLKTYLNELNTVKEELVWVFYHIPGDFQDSFKKTILNGQEVFFKKHLEEDWKEIDQLPEEAVKIPQGDEEDAQHLSLYFYQDGDFKHLYRESQDSENRVIFYSRTKDTAWKAIPALPKDCKIAPGQINEKVFQSLKWTYFGDLGMGRWKFKKAEFNRHMIYFMRKKGFWEQIQDPQDHMFDHDSHLQWEYWVHHVSFDLVFRRRVTSEGLTEIYQRVEGGKWVKIDKLPKEAVLLKNGQLGGFDHEIAWQYFTLPGINQAMFKAGKYKGEPIYFKKNTAGQWEIIDQLPSQAIPYEKDKVIWRFYVIPGQYHSIFKKAVIDGQVYIYRIDKGQDPVKVDELPSDCKKITIEDLKAKIKQTEKIYYFGIKGLNEKLFKRVYVRNAWRNFRRLTLGGWVKLDTMPGCSLEYQKGLVTQFVDWRYMNMPGDFDTVYRQAKIDGEVQTLKKNVSGQWEYLPVNPDGTIDSSKSGIHDQLEAIKWEYFTNPGENSKDFRRRKLPNGNYLYQEKDEYGNWQNTDRIPEKAVPFIHDDKIWKFCQVEDKPDILYKKGKIDDIDHYFSKNLMETWEMEDTLPEDCEELTHKKLMEIFPKFVEWTHYGVIGIDYKFYKKGKWHGRYVYYKKKLDGSWIKIEQLPEVATLFNTGAASDEIEWTYYQSDHSDDYLLKVHKTLEGQEVGLIVNRAGDMEHLDKVPLEIQEIDRKLFEDFVNGDGWDYFGVPGINKKLYRKTKTKEGTVFEKKDWYGNWHRIQEAEWPAHLVKYIHKHYDTKYHYLKGDFGVIYKKCKKNGHWLYYKQSDRHNWQQVDSLPDELSQFDEENQYYDFLDKYLKLEMFYYTVPGVNDKLYRRFFWEGEWVDQKRDVDGGWEVIPKLPVKLLPYKPQAVWPKVKEHFYIHPNNETMIFKKIFDGHVEAFFQMNQKGIWSQIENLPEGLDELSEEDLHQLIMKFIPWVYYGIKGINEKLYRIGQWAGSAVVQKLGSEGKWEDIKELPDFCVKWVDFKVKWIYYLEPGNSQSVFRKGLQFDGTWKHQQKDEGDEEWREVDSLPEDKLIQVEQKEIEDLLQTEVKWIPYTLPHLNHPIYKKGIFGDHNIFMAIQEDGSLKPIRELPENSIPYYETEFCLIPEDHDDIYFKKKEHGSWKFYSRSVNNYDQVNLLKFPEDCYEVLFEEIPALLPLKLNWEYYGVTGENKKLFRESKWGRYMVYEGISNSDVWRKIKELPENATPYLYPKYFKYGISPNDLDKFYISMLQRGRYTYYQVQDDQARVVKKWPANLLFMSKNEIIDILGTRVNWMFYTKKGDHKAEFKACTLAGKQIFMKDSYQDGDSLGVDRWVLIDRLPKNAIPYQQYINWEYCISTHDLNMVFKSGLFYDKKLRYYMNASEKQWKQIADLPTCKRITKQEAEDLIDNGPQWEYFAYPESPDALGRRVEIGTHTVFQMKDRDGKWGYVENLPESFIP